MVTKKQSKNCYSEKNKLCFLLQTVFVCFSQAHNFRSVAITNCLKSKEKNTKQELCKHGPLQKLEIRPGGMEE